MYGVHLNSIRKSVNLFKDVSIDAFKNPFNNVAKDICNDLLKLANDLRYSRGEVK